MSYGKIHEINVRAVKVPMSEPHRTASGTVTSSPLVLTDVLTNDGAVGHSMVFTYNEAALKPTADLIRNLIPLVIGEPLTPAAITHKLQERVRLLGPEGIVGIALAAIDMALWDALARQQSLPLVRLLGGCERPIRAYGAVGFDGALESARGAEEWAKRGFKAVKAKIGYQTLREDLDVVRAIRQATGDDMQIIVDYNQSLTPAEAIQRLRALDDVGLTWIEEPVLAHDHQGHATVAREIKTPIQCGENWWGALEVRQALAVDAVDYLMLDVMKIGGVTGWLRAAALAEAHSVPFSNHLWPEISAQLLCASPLAFYLEYANWWNSIIEEPLKVEDGFAIASSSAGSGISWDEKAVERFLV